MAASISWSTSWRSSQSAVISIDQPGIAARKAVLCIAGKDGEGLLERQQVPGIGNAEGNPADQPFQVIDGSRAVRRPARS